MPLIPASATLQTQGQQVNAGLSCLLTTLKETVLLGRVHTVNPNIREANAVSEFEGY